MGIILSKRAKKSLSLLEKENKREHIKIISKINEFLNTDNFETNMELLRISNQIKPIQRKNRKFLIHELRIMSKNNFRIFFYLNENTLILEVVKKKVNAFNSGFFDGLDIEISKLLARSDEDEFWWLFERSNGKRQGV